MSPLSTHSKTKERTRRSDEDSWNRVEIRDRSRGKDGGKRTLETEKRDPVRDRERSRDVSRTHHGSHLRVHHHSEEDDGSLRYAHSRGKDSLRSRKRSREQNRSLGRNPSRGRDHSEHRDSRTSYEKPSTRARRRGRDHYRDDRSSTHQERDERKYSYSRESKYAKLYCDTGKNRVSSDESSRDSAEAEPSEKYNSKVGCRDSEYKLKDRHHSRRSSSRYGSGGRRKERRTSREPRSSVKHRRRSELNDSSDGTSYDHVKIPRDRQKHAHHPHSSYSNSYSRRNTKTEKHDGAAKTRSGSNEAVLLTQGATKDRNSSSDVDTKNQLDTRRKCTLHEPEKSGQHARIEDPLTTELSSSQRSSATPEGGKDELPDGTPMDRSVENARPVSQRDAARDHVTSDVDHNIRVEEGGNCNTPSCASRVIPSDVDNHENNRSETGMAMGCVEAAGKETLPALDMDQKKLKRLERVRRMIGDMKEKGLVLPSTVSAEKDQESKKEEECSEVGVSSGVPLEVVQSTENVSLVTQSDKDVPAPMDATSNPDSTSAPSSPVTVTATSVLPVEVKETDVLEEEPLIDSLDAYMAVIANEVEELQNAKPRKPSRRRRKKAVVEHPTTPPEPQNRSQSITLEEILALQKGEKDPGTSSDAGDPITPDNCSSGDCTTKPTVVADGVDVETLLPTKNVTLPGEHIERESGVNAKRIFNVVEELKSLEDRRDRGGGDGNEDFYHEQFIAAIRTHNQQLPDAKAPPLVDDRHEPKDDVCEETGTVKTAEKSETLDNPDDDDYRYNILDDAATQSYFDLVQKVGSKKELPSVDHSTIDYPPFEKNIYVQVREITLMKDHEVDALRKLHSGIRVRGKRCPRPILNFYQCGLPNSILRIIEKKEYETPFPIQMQAIPALMAGRDVIAIAETGSGKTLAYLLPLLRHVLHQPPLRSNDGPIGLVLAPTRELAVQIQREAHRYTKATGLRSTSVYGGTGIGEQLSALKRGSEIVIGTPGRLIDVLTINNGKILNLRRVTFCILDEADRMFDMGFEPQITSILKNIQPDRQTALFSATFPPVIESLARRILHKPIEISVGDKGQTASRIEQYIEVWSNYREKFLRLLQLLGEWNEHGSIIIFVSRQNEADELFAELLKYGYPSFVLHGGQDQADRDFTIQDFKEGNKSILVATSVAARGLDVKSVVLVINFVAPDHLEDYVHRIGRTGRAGNIGVAYTFLTPHEGDKAEDLIKALKQSHRPIPETVQELANEFRAKCNLGLASQHKKKGFGGKGFKFTAAEKSRQQQERQRVKKQMGMNESDNEDESTYLDNEDLENPMAPMPPAAPPFSPGVPVNTVSTGDDVETASARAKALAELIAKQAPTISGTAPSAATSMNGVSPVTPLPPSGIHPLTSVTPSVTACGTTQLGLATTPDDKARQVAALRTTLQHQLGMNAPSTHLPAATTAAADIVQRSLSFSTSATAAAAVAAATAAGLSLRGNSSTGFPGATGGIPGLSSMAYIDQATGNAVDEFEINDYPQYARFKIMHKDILHRIADQTAAVLQVKGRYIAPEEKDSPLNIGVKRLYIEIIGATPIIVQRARHEIRTLLEAVSLKQLNVGSNIRPPGRYSVI